MRLAKSGSKISEVNLNNVVVAVQLNYKQVGTDSPMR